MKNCNPELGVMMLTGRWTFGQDNIVLCTYKNRAQKKSGLGFIAAIFSYAGIVFFRFYFYAWVTPKI